MMLKAVPFAKLALAFAFPENAVASGQTVASRSFCAYWLRAGSGSQYRPYPARKTVFGLSVHAIPTRGPQLSLIGGGAKNLLPARTTLLKCGSFLNASGMQGAPCATLQSGGISVAPMVHF